MKSLFYNKKLFIFLLGIMAFAIVFGSCLPIFLTAADKKLVSDYLSKYVFQVSNGVDSISILINSLVGDGFFSFLIWILGISIIGIPFLIFLFFFKCFLLGFSICSIIYNYGFKGVLFGILYIFPYHTIYVLIYLILTYFSLIFSFKLCNVFFGKKEINIRGIFKKYFKIFVLCVLVGVILSFYEAFISPIVLRFIFSFIKI
jgi:stage II sporulation protein M